MNDKNVTPAETAAKPDPFAEVAAALYRIADDIVSLTGSGLPKPSVSLSIQLGSRSGDDELTVRAVDAVSSALLGHPGQVQLMSGGVYHYNNGDSNEAVGAVDVRVLYSISTEFAVKRHAVSLLAKREAELEQLRAEVAELRAAQATTKPLVSDETIAAAGRMGSWNERKERWDDGLAYSREPESTVAAPVPAGVEGHPEFGGRVVHMSLTAGGSACGLPVEGNPTRLQSLVWRDVTCQACIDGAR